MGVGVLSVVFNTILNFWYARKIVRFGFVWDFDYIKHIFKISLPYGIALFLSFVYFKEDILLLSLMEGPGQGDISIALYSLPMKIVEVVMVVGGFYMTSLLPTLTRYFQEVFEKKKAGLLQEGEIIQKKIDTLILISFKVLFAASFFIFIVGVLFRRSLIQIIAKSDYLLPQPIFSSSDAFLVVFSVVIFYFISLFFIYTLIFFHH